MLKEGRKMARVEFLVRTGTSRRRRRGGLGESNPPGNKNSARNTNLRPHPQQKRESKSFFRLISFWLRPSSSSTKPIDFHLVRLRVLTDQLLLHPSHRCSTVMVEREPLYTTTCFFAKNFRFVFLFPYLNGKISDNTVFGKTAKECFSCRRNNDLYFLKKDSEVIIQLQLHCLEKHQTLFFSVFFLEQILSIYLSRSSQQKNLQQEFCVRCTNKMFYHQLRIQL